MKILFALLLMTSVLCGAALDFRGGKILCAELSLVRPPVSGFDPSLYKNLPVNPIYAAVTITCDDGRRLSVHDFGIESGGVYPCIAFKKEKGRFNGSIELVENVRPKVRYTLLFMLDASYMGLNDEEIFAVKALFPPDKYSRQQVPFRNLRKKPFTATEKIPLSGLMPEPK